MARNTAAEAEAPTETEDNAVEEFTEEERAALRSYQRKQRQARVAKMTPEQLAAQQEKRTAYNQERLAAIKADPERLTAFKERQKAYRSARYAALKEDPEAMAAFKERMSSYRKNRSQMTPEQRLAAIEKEQAKLATEREAALAELNAAAQAAS